MRLPKLRVGNIHHAAPEIGLGLPLLPIAEILRVEFGELRRHPRLRVHAIGDAGDRNFVRRHSRPDVFPERSADFAVEFADAVRMPAHAQGEDGHAERVQRIHARLAEGE